VQRDFASSIARTFAKLLTNLAHQSISQNQLDGSLQPLTIQLRQNKRLIMKLAIFSLLPIFVLSSEELYSYDPSNELGPENWAMVDVSGGVIKPQALMGRKS
jgi:hypothetical protein